MRNIGDAMFAGEVLGRGFKPLDSVTSAGLAVELMQ